MPEERLGAAVVQIACDESGFTGTNLLHPSSPVLAHASVDLRMDEAAKLMTTLRAGFRLTPDELKSGQFLRGSRSTELREWLLVAVAGRAHVHLIDKKLFLVERVLDLFLSERPAPAGLLRNEGLELAARALSRAGEEAGGPWEEFLAAALDVLRTKRVRRAPRERVARFLQARDGLTAHGIGDEGMSILDRLSRTEVSRRLADLAQDDLAVPPPLEPMLPALVATVLFWSKGHRPVLVVHDEQSALTARRLRWLQQALADERDADISPLAGLLTVDSRGDPRVQVADLLAGMARRAHERGDRDDTLPVVPAP